VTQRRENDLLDRTEVRFSISHPQAGTPGRGDIRKALAAVLNAKDAVVILDWARSEFGRTSTRGYAKVYKSKERAMALETPPILIRNGLLQRVAKKEAPKEAPEAPAPRGEKKEAKPEPKPEAAKEAPKEEAPKKEPSAKPAKDDGAKKEAPKPPREEKKEAPGKKEPAKKEEAPKEKKPAAKKEGK